MKNKLGFVVFSMLVLAIGIAAAGCATATVPKPERTVDWPALEEVLYRYVVPAEEEWEKGEKVYIYYFDPFHFADVKAVVDMGGEYSLLEEQPAEPSTVTFAGCYVRANGNVHLYIANGKEKEYIYKNITASGTLGPRLEEVLQKYPGPQVETEDDGNNIFIYHLDPLRFEAFKAELDTWVNAGAEYTQGSPTTDTRDWYKGRSFARFVVQVVPADRYGFVLRLYKEDNSVIEYRYNKN